MKLFEKMKRFYLKKQSNGGFTLVELIVVIAILAILAGIAVPAYSGYVEKANKQADINLASEVEQALMLAHYNGKLNEGATVAIHCGEGTEFNVVCSDVSAEDAMSAAFGTSYKETLRLKYDGWVEEIGVAGDAATMEIVKKSNFTYENLDNLLSQVQVVVGAAGSYLEGSDISAEAAELLKANGISISAGDKLTAETANAAANSYVYFVGGELAKLDISGNPDTWTSAEAEFLMSWMNNSSPNTQNFDVVTGSATQYASIYALATYIDKNTGNTNYVEQLEQKGDITILSDATAILASMKSEQSDLCSAYMNDEAYKDAVSFLAYMQGLDASTDSLMQKTDLMSNDYFVDGYVANYVNDYITVSGILTANGDSGNSFVFLYTGEDVRCMPLDW